MNYSEYSKEDFLYLKEEEDDYLEYLKEKDYPKCLKDDLSIVSYSIVQLRNYIMGKEKKNSYTLRLY